MANYLLHDGYLVNAVLDFCGMALDGQTARGAAIYQPHPVITRLPVTGRFDTLSATETSFQDNLQQFDQGDSDKSVPPSYRDTRSAQGSLFMRKNVHYSRGHY